MGQNPVDPATVAKKWRLQPGKIFLVDFEEGRIVDDGTAAELRARCGIFQRLWRLQTEGIASTHHEEPTLLRYGAGRNR